jgi:hypothetical protein
LNVPYDYKKPNPEPRIPPERSELVKDFDREMYEKSLHMGSYSTGSQAIDERLTKQFGDMRTGAGYGLRRYGGETVKIEDDEIISEGYRS